jgi:hypothetical protein
VATKEVAEVLSVAKHEGPKAVPLRLEKLIAVGRQFGEAPSKHRLQEGGYG